ncbi:MAG: PAS domain S-box protein [Desulfobacteraceae bacterium]|nr:PAS domain S-box protein [Desulfobacteraceae bacterium]
MAENPSYKELIKDFQQAALKYKTSFDNARDGITVFSLDAVIIDANKKIIEMSGYTFQELTSMKLASLYPDFKSEAGRKRQEALKQGKNPPLFEAFLLTKQNKKIPIEIAVTPVKNWPGQKLVFQGNVRDITDRKRAEKELLRSAKLKSIGQLAGGIAHYFNNILTNIYGNISLAKMELDPREEAYTHIESAESSMTEAANLAKQLLTFAKGGDPIKEALSIDRFVKSTAVFNLTGSNVKLDFKAQEKLLKVHVDKDQIEQVISNLVINAREAMPDGGRLGINVENVDIPEHSPLRIEHGSYIKIMVIDQGCGIPEENHLNIFDPYFTTKITGSGMGLATSYSIIKKHNGHIIVSSNKDKGTTFTIFLKVISSEKAIRNQSKDDAACQEHKSSLKVLVMDDEDHIREMSKAILQKLGCSVKLAIDGDEAIEKYKQSLQEQEPFGLIIMDLTIPGGMGGKESSRILLDLDPDVKIVISSGYSNDPVMANHEEYGLNGILPKPYQIADLKKIVEQNFK